MSNFDTNNPQTLYLNPDQHGIQFKHEAMPRLQGYDRADHCARFTLPPCGVVVLQMLPGGYRSTHFDVDRGRKTVNVTKADNN